VNEALVTRRKDGTIVIAAWNLVEPGEGPAGESGPTKTETFDLKDVSATQAEIRRVDAAHGDTLDAWKKMGSPRYPTKAQVEGLQKVSELGAPETVAIQDHRLTVKLPPMGLAVIEIGR
jgi:xylan 1,4-beta-xylosidase